MIRCIIIEDQPPAQRILIKYIGDMVNMELLAVFPDALQAMDILKTATIDLIFLDIHLPKISGIDFLKALTQRPQVILTTAFSDYAIESYEYNVIDYLLKPFSFERFVKAVSKISGQKSEPEMKLSAIDLEQSKDVIFIKSGHDHIKINTSEILFIKSELDYTEIFTNNKKYLTSYSLKYWLECLIPKKFAQVHKSYIVNTDKIIKVSGNLIVFDASNSIPIGRAFKNNFVKNYLN